MDYAKVLIVDTNIELYNESVGIWNSYGIKSDRVDDIEQALKALLVYKYHLIVIVECKEQRSFVLGSIEFFQELTLAPIIIASTDPVESEYRIAGLNMGADEIWEMPKKIEEAVAKGNAIIRRYLQFNKEMDRKSTIIINMPFILSTAHRLVYLKGIKVELPKIEFDILTLLITHPNRVFTHEQIYSEIWDEKFTDNAKENLRNHIYKLRDTLKIDPTLSNFIKNHHGIGYSFTPRYDNK